MIENFQTHRGSRTRLVPRFIQSNNIILVFVYVSENEPGFSSDGLIVRIVFIKVHAYFVNSIVEVGIFLDQVGVESP